MGLALCEAGPFGVKPTTEGFTKSIKTCTDLFIYFIIFSCDTQQEPILL
jgi:hypothetical protein